MRSGSAESSLARLAALMRERNRLERDISVITGRPASLGHLGEYLAATIFDVRLVTSASHRAIDGYFAAGPLAGRSVDVKWYSLQESVLDLNAGPTPDYYLVFAGPKAAPVGGRQVRPWSIESVYLFGAAVLLQAMRDRGARITVAASVLRRHWDEAEIYPVQRNHLLTVSDEQRRLLGLFSAAAISA